MCETLFYSAKKTARILGLTLGDVSTLCNEGILQSCHSGTTRLVVPASVTAYAASLLAKP